ncbi:hypothetical protein [Kribbella sindirgiensis]|uniref:Uncharacterized protein n=1 Tax=Kribbella sindirgiensis TaxID=1124744 RepID=A0A4R0IU42_9ACTN|nr:hypothetical protein [Kribbella sindirgiensis]TCC34958.1 hypothetical protein E0H50_13795 [Kribbella sindirgiensis]
MKRSLSTPDWARRCLIIGVFALMAEMLVVFAIVVTRLNPEDAITWVMIGFDHIFNLVLIVVAYFFGKRHSSDPDDEPPTKPAPPNVHPLPTAARASRTRSLKAKNAKGRSRRRR